MAKPFNLGVLKEVEDEEFKIKLVEAAKDLKQYTDFVKEQGFPSIALAEGNLMIQPDDLVSMFSNYFIHEVDFDKETAERLQIPALKITWRLQAQNQIQQFLYSRGYVSNPNTIIFENVPLKEKE